jgi:ABC-2 type transport system ATP-binding protein
VTKAYDGVPCLRGVDLDVAEGEIVGLLGRNGAGKTTLVSIVAGLLAPDSGSVEVFGVDALAAPYRVRHLLGLAPQRLGIYPRLSVADNLRTFAEIAGLRGRAARRVDEVAGLLDLGDLLGRRAGQLSGGQQRRLHTAIALMGRPRVLLLDEPTVGADVEARHGLLGVVRGLATEGVGVVYTTHYLEEIEALRGSVVVLEAGEVLASGTIDELVERTGTAFVELTFDGEPPAEVRSRAAAVDGPRVRIAIADPAVDAARVLAGLVDVAGRLLGVRIVRPSLESVYLSLTGRPPTDDADRGGSLNDLDPVGSPLTARWDP